jgi:hypothetical protein
VTSEKVATEDDDDDEMNVEGLFSTERSSNFRISISVTVGSRAPTKICTFGCDSNSFPINGGAAIIVTTTMRRTPHFFKVEMWSKSGEEVSERQGVKRYATSQTSSARSCRQMGPTQTENKIEYFKLINFSIVKKRMG